MGSIKIGDTVYVKLVVEKIVTDKNGTRYELSSPCDHFGSVKVEQSDIVIGVANTQATDSDPIAESSSPTVQES